MSQNYADMYTPARTPQSEPIPGKMQKMNNAGGFAFELDKWARLRRFLILGSDAPTYYQAAKALTRENAKSVLECWGEDPGRTAAAIVDISHRGLAPKNDAAIFALALGAITPDPNVTARQEAYAAVNRVCRTATHLFQFLDYCKRLGKGHGRGMKRAIANWYGTKSIDQLAFQAVKYRNREGWTHADAILVAHQGKGERPEIEALYKWIRGKEIDRFNSEALPKIVQGHLAAMAIPESAPGHLIDIIREHKLPWEALPSWANNNRDILNALIPDMGLTALIRQLGKMTAAGAIDPQHWKHVTDRIGSGEDLRKSRIHPFAVLLATKVYQQGRGEKGKLTWQPVRQIIDALDAAFYEAFENVPATGKRLMLALDVSGSMDSQMGGSPISCREAAAAMALVTLAREPEAMVYGFTRGSSPTMHYGYGAACTPLGISPRQRLGDVVRDIAGLQFGGTDCALPFITAQAEGLSLDGVVVYTDNETWAGDIHPTQALALYRRHTGIDTRSAVVGMTATPFSIADPADGGMMDFVGFDASAPAVMADFLAGSL